MRAPSPRQLTLDLPHRPALGHEDFLLGDSNRAAVAAIDGWPSWSHPVLVLSGPAGSGKSHLAHVWRLRSGATAVTAGQLTDGSIVGLRASAACVVVEDIDRRNGETVVTRKEAREVLGASEVEYLGVPIDAQLVPRVGELGCAPVAQGEEQPLEPKNRLAAEDSQAGAEPGEPDIGVGHSSRHAMAPLGWSVAEAQTCS